MAKEPILKGSIEGCPIHSPRRAQVSPGLVEVGKFLTKSFRALTGSFDRNGSYAALATILCVVLISLVLPDISSRIHSREKLKNVVDIISKEVKHAEAACLTTAKQMCCLHCTMNDGKTATIKEMNDLSMCTSCCLQATRSEPTPTPEKIGFLRHMLLPHWNPKSSASPTTYKEVALMSFVYTDSFDANKKISDLEEE